MRKLCAKPFGHRSAVDITAVYVALVLVSAGVATSGGPAYYAGVVGGTACLPVCRATAPRSFAAGVAMLALAAGIGHVAHVGLAESAVAARRLGDGADLIRSADPDPYAVRTESARSGA